MYWWNVSKLAEDLREGRVDEKERFKYFLATFIAWSLAVLLFSYSPGPFNLGPPLSVGIHLIMVTVGIVFCYRANKSGDNADFIARMICMGLPVSIQLAAYFSTLFLFLGVIESLPVAALGLSPFLSTIPGAGWKAWTNAGSMGMIFVFSYFQIIYAHIAFAAKVKGAENSKILKQTNWSAERIIFGLLSGNMLVVVIVLAGIWVPSSDESNFAWQLVTLLGVALWTVLFVLVFSRLRPPSVKRTLTANQMNQ
jgi:hypothetical protein